MLDCIWFVEAGIWFSCAFRDRKASIISNAPTLDSLTAHARVRKMK